MMDGSLEPEFFKITKKTVETHDTFTIELKPYHEKPLLFEAGQFNMLYVFGVGEVPISISGVPQNTGAFVHTIKVVGNVTKALSRLELGDEVGVRGPFGSPWPLKAVSGRDLLLLAGGIGLAPLRPVLYHLMQNRKAFGRVALLYGARDPADLIFHEDLVRWERELEGQVLTTVDLMQGDWKGNVGVVTHLIPQVLFPMEEAVAFLCGPEIMLRFSIRELLEKEMREENMYLAMERNMRCGIGLCGHCQYVSNFLCKEGSILSYPKVKPFLSKKEI